MEVKALFKRIGVQPHVIELDQLGSLHPPPSPPHALYCIYICFDWTNLLCQSLKSFYYGKHFNMDSPEIYSYCNIKLQTGVVN